MTVALATPNAPHLYLLNPETGEVKVYVRQGPVLAIADQAASN